MEKPGQNQERPSTTPNRPLIPSPESAKLALSLSIALLAVLSGCGKNENAPRRIPKVHTIGIEACGAESDREAERPSRDRRKQRPANSPTLMPHVKPPGRNLPPSYDRPQPQESVPPEGVAPPATDPPPEPLPPSPQSPPEEYEVPPKIVHFTLKIEFSPQGIPGQISITPPPGWQFKLQTGTSQGGTIEYLLILTDSETSQTAIVDITPHMTRVLASRSSRPLDLEASVPVSPTP